MKGFRKAPEIHVGIVRSKFLEFGFPHPYLSSEGAKVIEGKAEAVISSGGISLKQDGRIVAEGPELIFRPADISSDGFGISQVVIGIGFHWEQKQDQYFEGVLKLLIVDGEILAINQVHVLVE